MRGTIIRVMAAGVVCLACGVEGANLSREDRLRNQIEPALAQDAIELRVNNTAFLALHRGAERMKRRGAVILLHDMEANPATPNVIQPLRLGLPRHGWETLSLQMPLADRGAWRRAYIALIPEALPRIDAAITWLKQRKAEHIVLLGYGTGARVAIAYAGARSGAPLLAVVAISLETDTAGFPPSIRRRLPLLDIFAGRDLRGVLATAPLRRRVAAERKHTGFRQIEIAGAGPTFRHFDDMLLRRITAWLSKQLPP